MEQETSTLFSISDEPEKVDSFTTILYNKGITVEPEETTDVSPKPKSSRLCFNCGKDNHTLRDCPKPHNPAKITRNRTQFNSRTLKKGVEFTRYHKEIDDRFSDFRPGVLSSKLKEALGLKKDKLPRHIYNMRRLGYPPGWLEEAKIGHSGINMLDSNGERVPDPDEEEGEICTSRIKYDDNKIINYPGFNVWPDPGTINETETYGSLPMCYDQSKEAFIERLNDTNFSNEYSVGQGFKSNLQCSGEDDMDVEELDINIKYDYDADVAFGFIPPLPDDNPPTPPPPPPEDIPLPSVIKNSVISVDSSSDEVLLLSSEEEEGELPSKTSSRTHRNKTTKRTLPSERERSRSPLSSPKEKQVGAYEKVDEKWPTTPVHLSNNNSTESIVADDQSKTVKLSFGRVKSIELGTPVLNHSSYQALPLPEKFRKDISDVIYFENLPNSTGKYERLKDVLRNVRSKLSTLRGGPANKVNK